MGMTRRVALLVGIDGYEDPQFLPLTSAENDAIELFGFLKQKAGYDVVRLLRRPASHVVLDTAIDLTANLELGDTFVFYFAGHGLEQSGRHLLLCPKARFKRLSYLQEVVPVDLLREETERPGLNRIFILDSCRRELRLSRGLGAESQGFQGEAGLRDIVSRRPIKKSETGSLAILCGCSEGQVAREIVSCGQGLFTASLLEVCQEAAKGGYELALSDELERAIRDKMARLATRHELQGGQTPWITRSGPPPVLIPGRRPGPQVSREPVEAQILDEPALSIESVPSAADVSVDGRKSGRTPCRLILEAGEHRIRIEKEDYRVWEKRIRFQAKTDEKLRIALEGKPRPLEAFFPMTTQEAAEVQRAAAEALGVPLRAEEKLGQGAKLRMILISPGTFMMGASDEDSEAFSREKPRHEVTISRAYYLGVYPVTQAEWKAVMGDNPSSNRRGGDYPVESVSWDMVQKFILRLNEKTKKRYRLPTEAEWEYACRAGTEGSRYGELDDIGWYDGNSGGETHPVGKLLPNAFGLYDMLGNVWEWCQDWWGEYDGWAQTDPKGPTSGDVRVLRGGSWNHDAQYVRASDRYCDAPGYRHYYLGFRLARNVD